MQAIQTKYIGPTNTRGSRIKAWCTAGSVTIGYPQDLTGQAVYRAAAEALVANLGWTDVGALLGGALPGDSGYCFVLDNSSARG